MSIIEQAKSELKRVNFGEEDSAVMIQILEMFFGHWDSGGAVHFAAPVLQRLIAGKCVTPLSGADDEWVDHGSGVFQNIRCGSVFKDPRFHEGKLAYDIDRRGNERDPIEFPYWPINWEVASPIVEIEVDEAKAADAGRKR